MEIPASEPLSLQNQPTNQYPFYSARIHKALRCYNKASWSDRDVRFTSRSRPRMTKARPRTARPGLLGLAKATPSKNTRPKVPLDHVSATVEVRSRSKDLHAGFSPQTAKRWPGFRRKPRNRSLCGEVRLKQACGRQQDVPALGSG